MSTPIKNKLIDAKSNFKMGSISKFEYANEVNMHHACLFDYPSFLAGTDVRDICITAEGVVVSSIAHEVSMFIDSVDLHATPYTLLDFGSYETDETIFLTSVFHEGDVFLDVGANLGWYSLVLGKKVPKAHIYAFEPIPSTMRVFEKNINLNNISNIKTFCLGLFNKEDEMSFLYAEDVSGATSLKLAGQTRGAMPVTEVLCKTTTLDIFCRNNAITPDLIKIDVEGAELMVVQGGVETLKHTPIILIELLRKWSKEFGYHPNDVFKILASYGYTAWVFSKSGSGKLLPCESITEDTVQTNFVFMHPLKHADIISTWMV